MEKSVNKFCGVVVLYNPTLDVVKNIKTYAPYLGTLFVVDNSETINTSVVSSLKDISNIIYLYLNGNKGIAYALNVGIKKAIDYKFPFCLTMDQDSSFLTNTWEKFVNEFNQIEDKTNIGIIGLNFKNSHLTSNQFVKTWITSGNFINLDVFKRTKGFDNELFIDYVDFDFNEKLDKLNKKIFICADALINHRIGNPIKKKILFKTFYCMNHSPIRYYYRYRNSLYLYKKNKNFYRKIYYKELIVQTLKMILFESKRKEKLILIKKGRCDARKNILGKFYGK